MILEGADVRKTITEADMYAPVLREKKAELMKKVKKVLAGKEILVFDFSWGRFRIGVKGTLRKEDFEILGEVAKFKRIGPKYIPDYYDKDALRFLRTI